MYKSAGMSRRGFVRLISFLTAGVTAFAVMAGVNHWRNNVAKRHIEYNYLRSLESLSMSIDNIKTSLNKGIYSNSPQMLSEISGKLSSEASGAKMSLSQLPVTKLNLENTNKFLSQVGNYAHSLSKKFTDGEELTSEERGNLSKLLEHAEGLSNELWSVESMVSGGHLTFEEVVHDTLKAEDDVQYPAHISDGFSNVEEIFADYPSLIYDGPFSDHIMQQEPKMLSGMASVSKEDALVTARKVSGSERLEYASDQGGKMPCYSFSDGETNVSVTQNAGLFAYMLRYRQIGEKSISADRAIEIAEEYLGTVGYDNMVHTYFELSGGVCVINFAKMINDVTVYTDMVKVGVALDNGEIMSLDARAYITAHHNRMHLYGEPGISEREAAEKLSKSLTMQNAKLAVIPSSGEHERFCWEFLCKADNGNNVLVYINAESGAEEQILLMRISDNGTFAV
ncbi:MAG: germination protein YpeB [Oscillospiraceae bacterium]|nr:germination protein YpeB [Oscillospiraceae bacterium]